MTQRQKRVPPSEEQFLHFEHEAYEAGYPLVAGLDESGRGPLAGPVVAAAVILPHDLLIPGVWDSKALTPRARLNCATKIEALALSIGVGLVENEEIDQINILQATLKAMKIAVEKLSIRPDFLLIDGITPLSQCTISQRCIVRGDQLSLSIASASIIAKVTRDERMKRYHDLYPHYNFLKNKGYGTEEHRFAIQKFGPCPIHRKTFRRVREYVNL